MKKKIYKQIMAKLKVYLGGNFCFFLYLSEYLTILVNMHMFEGQALQKKKNARIH